MMSQTVKLGDICFVRRGTTITKKQAIEGNIPVVAGGIKPTYFHNKPNREAGAITISGSGANAGFINFWDMPIFASDCSTIEPNDDTQNRRFVYFYLISQQQYIYDNFRSGTAQPHVYPKDIANLDYPLIALAEQKRIVAKLDKAFAEIDSAIAAMERKKKEIEKFKMAFLRSNLNAGNNDWKVSSVIDIATISTGKRNAYHASVDGKYRFYTCASKYQFCDTKKFSGDCLILPGNGANVGDVYFYSGEFDAYQRTYVIHNIKISPYYLMYHMSLNWNEANKNKQFGSATNFIKIGNFKDYIVNYPTLKEQELIVEKLDQAFQQADIIIANIQKQLNEYQLLKTALLKSELQSEAA